MENEKIIPTSNDSAMKLLERRLSDGSPIYAVRLNDRDNNFAIFDCVDLSHATRFMTAYHECTL
jgi:hypothetical protein